LRLENLLAGSGIGGEGGCSGSSEQHAGDQSVLHVGAFFIVINDGRTPD
jgi:hypothetical protein